MLEELKARVLNANLALVKYNLVLFTWGNASGFDREKKLFVIKPSGVPYEELKAEDLIVVDLDGNVVEGRLRPSSDTPSHAEFYRAFPEVGGVVHTHSTYATAWAQAGRDIPFYGTTHADYFHGDIPCARALTREEIEGKYEKNTALAIIETFKERGISPKELPGALVKSHGVFAFGKDADEAVYHAAVLEEVAKMACLTERISPSVPRADTFMLEKHYSRKHGKNAYYGQTKK